MGKKVKFNKKYQEGTNKTDVITFGKEPGVGRAVGKVLSGFADDKGKGYSISPTEVMKNLATPFSLLSGCAAPSSTYRPQKNPNRRPSGRAGCKGPKDRSYIRSIQR
jgi:hypothetical protein